MQYKAAVIQHRYYPDNLDKALNRVEELIDECSKWGVKLICMQEYAVIGYPRREFAESIPGAITERLGEKCKERGLYLVAGSILEKAGDQFFNTVPLINPQGKIVGKYRKVNLINSPPKKEIDTGLSEGENISVFETEIGKIGLLLGADLDPCEPCRILSIRGCEVLLAPHSCVGKWVDAHRYIAKTRAWENTFYVLAPNPCGEMSTPYGDVYYLGSSSIISPMGELLANVGEFEEGFAVTTIDLEKVRKLKEQREWNLRKLPKAYNLLVEYYQNYRRF